MGKFDDLLESDSKELSMGVSDTESALGEPSSASEGISGGIYIGYIFDIS